MSTITRYKWTCTFESSERAMETATRFHMALKGNKDYIDSNILLNVTGNTVLLAEFIESKTHVRIARDNNNDWQLKFL